MGPGGALLVTGVIAVCTSSTIYGGICVVPLANTFTIPLPPPII